MKKGAKAQRRKGVKAQRRNGATAQRYNGIRVQVYWNKILSREGIKGGFYEQLLVTGSVFKLPEFRNYRKFLFI
jgi:hypothetical protein